jgi:hypothetical protein
MPFTVFTTSHKKSMLKWLSKLTPEGAGSSAAGSRAPASARFQVIDAGNGILTLMNRDGETLELALGGIEDKALRGAVVAAFEEGQDVHLVLEAGSTRVLSHSVG